MESAKVGTELSISIAFLSVSISLMQHIGLSFSLQILHSSRMFLAQCFTLWMRLSCVFYSEHLLIQAEAFVS